MIFRAVHDILKWMVCRFYGVELAGAENIPKDGPAVLVCNHVSYVDAAIITAALGRPVRFLMWRALYDLPVLGWIARFYNALPVSQADSPRAMRKSIQTAVDALKNGDLICLFPEGSMTRTAHLQPFKRGFELIARRAGAPIIPVHLDGLWGSIFSYARGRYFFKIPKFFGRRVEVTVGKPLPPDTHREDVRHEIMALGAEAYLPADYVRDPRLRIELYRKLHRAADGESVEAVRRELTDRFGALDLPLPR